MLCTVNWYREYPILRESDCWLSTGAKRGAAAFSDRHLFRTLDGGYIPKKDERLFRFPINVVRLSNGERQDFVLSVPFAGDVPWPQCGYAKSGDEYLHATGPYFMQISHFDIEGNRLRVVLTRYDNNSVALDFDLPALLKRKAG